MRRLPETLIKWFFPLYTRPLTLVALALTLPYWLNGKAFFRCVMDALKHHGAFMSSALVITTTYLLFLFCSISFFDASTPLNSRILAQLFT